MQRFLFASDSFKGSLSSARTAELLHEAALEVFPDAQTTSLEVAEEVAKQYDWCYRIGNGSTLYYDNFRT